MDQDSSASRATPTDKVELIREILELQNTLDDLSQRVQGVKEENTKLKSENELLAKYVENLVDSSTIFQKMPSC